MSLDEIIEADHNPKDHATDDLEASVSRFGFVEPITLDERTGKLVSGHGRLHELQRRHTAGEDPPEGVEVYQGTWTAPVVRGWASADDTEAEAYLVTANRLTEKGGWLDDGLAESLTRLAATAPGLEGIGYSDDDLEALLARLSSEPPSGPWRDRALRPMPDPGSFTGGQVWQIGPHRLVVGDARDPDAWAVLPEAQLMVTDPPYGIAYDGGGGVEREVIDGDLDSEAAATLLDAALGLAIAKLSAGGASYIFLPPGGGSPPTTGSRRPP